MTLSELREALEKAEEPSRELDAMMAVATLYAEQDAWSEECGKVTIYLDGGGKRTERSEKYTSSLDAAVGLVERALPRWEWSAESLSGTFYAEVVPMGGNNPVGAKASAPALALCLALTRAMEAEAG